MSWIICGTVPDDGFPLCLGSWSLDGGTLAPVSCRTLSGQAPPPSVPVLRGTPALAAAALAACNALGAQAPLLLLAGDRGTGSGSLALYEFLASWLPSGESESLRGLTFHYLFPDVDGHNRILMALDERKADFPVLIADAGFMYAAKMSGFAARYDVFTPDGGELAFLADEKAPHPFYTRGFLLSEGKDPAELARLAHEHEDSAKILLVKGREDLIVENGCVTDRISQPCVPSMEAIGGTGDLVAGLLTACAYAGMPLAAACANAAKAARFAGRSANPSPATPVANIIPSIPEGIERCLHG